MILSLFTTLPAGVSEYCLGTNAKLASTPLHLTTLITLVGLKPELMPTRGFKKVKFTGGVVSLASAPKVYTPMQFNVGE